MRLGHPRPGCVHSPVRGTSTGIGSSTLAVEGAAKLVRFPRLAVLLQRINHAHDGRGTFGFLPADVKLRADYIAGASGLLMARTFG